MASPTAGQPQPASTPEPDVSLREPVPWNGRWRLRAAILTAACLLLGFVFYAGRAEQDPAGGPIGRWESMAESPLSPRFQPTTIWVDSGLLVWGGLAPTGDAQSDGAFYDPRTNTWRLIAPSRSEPSPSNQNPATSTDLTAPSAWVGDEAVFLIPNSTADTAWDLVAYNPETDRWRTVDHAGFEKLANDELVRVSGSATVDVPYALFERDGRVLVFGWRSDLGLFGLATVDPLTGEWTDFAEIPQSGDLYGYPAMDNSPIIIDDHLVSLVQTLNNSVPMGYRVDLNTGASSLIGHPTDAAYQTFGLAASVTDDGLIVGIAISDQGQSSRVAYRLDPATWAWQTLAAPSTGTADEHNLATPIATPSGYMVIGGLDIPIRSGGLPSTASAYRAGRQVDGWTPLPTAPIDINRVHHTIVWTGQEIIVWGGATTQEGDPVNTATAPLNDGARFVIESRTPD